MLKKINQKKISLYRSNFFILNFFAVVELKTTPVK